jgi:hypothetical protein
MKFFHLSVLFAALFLSSCALYDTRHSASTPEGVSSPKPLAVPVGKNWQITEEPPQLSNDTGRLPFQTEQSLQPDAAKPVTPVDKNRKIETTR